jgi:hypothetical protein
VRGGGGARLVSLRFSRSLLCAPRRRRPRNEIIILCAAAPALRNEATEILHEVIPRAIIEMWILLTGEWFRCLIIGVFLSRWRHADIYSAGTPRVAVNNAAIGNLRGTDAQGLHCRVDRRLTTYSSYYFFPRRSLLGICIQRRSSIHKKQCLNSKMAACDVTWVRLAWKQASVRFDFWANPVPVVMNSWHWNKLICLYVECPHFTNRVSYLESEPDNLTFQTSR